MIRDELIKHDLYHVFSNSAQQRASTLESGFEIFDVVDVELRWLIKYSNSHPTQGNYSPSPKGICMGRHGDRIDLLPLKEFARLVMAIGIGV